MECYFFAGAPYFASTRLPAYCDRQVMVWTPEHGRMTLAAYENLEEIRT